MWKLTIQTPRGPNSAFRTVDHTAVPEDTEKTQVPRTEAGLLSFCSELEEGWPNVNTVFIKK